MTTGRINQISIGVLGATTLKRGIQPNNVSLMIVCCFFCLCNTVFFVYQKGANFHCTALRGRVFHVDLFFRLKFPRNAATIKYRFPFNQVSSCRNRSSALHVLGRAAAASTEAHTQHNTHTGGTAQFFVGAVCGKLCFGYNARRNKAQHPHRASTFLRKRVVLDWGAQKGTPE